MHESSENRSVKNFIHRQKYRQLFLEISYITLKIVIMTLMEEICGIYAINYTRLYRFFQIIRRIS